MQYVGGQLLNSPDIVLRGLLRLSPGPVRTDSEGLFSGGYVANEPESLVLTKSHNRLQIINPAASRTILLPSTGIRAGEIVTLVNRSTAYVVTVQAADASAIDILATGFIVVAAITDDPADNSAWSVVDVYETTDHTTTMTNLFASPPAVTIRFCRQGKSVTYIQPPIGMGTKSGTGNPTLTVAVPPRFRVSIVYNSALIMNNGTYGPGWVFFPANGLWQWRRADLSTWTNGANAGIPNTAGGYRLV